MILPLLDNIERSMADNGLIFPKTPLMEMSPQQILFLHGKVKIISMERVQNNSRLTNLSVTIFLYMFRTFNDMEVVQSKAPSILKDMDLTLKLDIWVSLFMKAHLNQI